MARLAPQDRRGRSCPSQSKRWRKSARKCCRWTDAETGEATCVKRVPWRSMSSPPAVALLYSRIRRIAGRLDTRLKWLLFRPLRCGPVAVVTRRIDAAMQAGDSGTPPAIDLRVALSPSIMQASVLGRVIAMTYSPPKSEATMDQHRDPIAGRGRPPKAMRWHLSTAQTETLGSPDARQQAQLALPSPAARANWRA